MSPHFRSLRYRLLVPLLAVALLASVAVAIVSYTLGDRWAREQVESRFRGIQDTLTNANFPLTGSVIRSIAQLTDTELVALNSDDSARQSSIDLSEQMSWDSVNWESINGESIGGDSIPTASHGSIEIEGQRFLARGFSLRTSSGSDGSRVVVLFDDADVRGWRHRAALLPLVTGLSTIVLLTSVVLWMIGRLIGRLSRLQQQVNGIAGGDFGVTIEKVANDEVGMLADSVSQMNQQLGSMWTTLERQQGEKLLHQVAGGLAHQLRNSITGARMAVELHQGDCDHAEESLNIAVSQLELTEQHIRRLLLVAAGKQDQDRPKPVDQCVHDVQSAVSTTASHLGVQLNWTIDESASGFIVTDGPSFSAALSNLIFNAMHESAEVQVRIRPWPESPNIDQSNIDQSNVNQSNVNQSNVNQSNINQAIRVDVIDNGNGPPNNVADEIFDPFVTSKPEGLGLGLPLVARSARRLGGTVEWCREHDQTRFTMTLPTQHA